MTRKWPKFEALAASCTKTGRYLELHVGQFSKALNGRPFTKLTIGIGNRTLLSQPITRGDLDKAAEALTRKLVGAP